MNSPNKGFGLSGREKLEWNEMSAGFAKEGSKSGVYTKSAR